MIHIDEFYPLNVPPMFPVDEMPRQLVDRFLNVYPKPSVIVNTFVVLEATETGPDGLTVPPVPALAVTVVVHHQSHEVSYDRASRSNGTGGKSIAAERATTDRYHPQKKPSNLNWASA